MYRFLLTVAIVAALTVAAGIWLEGHLREARRQERVAFELRLERELEKPISLAEVAGGDQTLDGVLLHIARQVNVPIVCNRAKLGDDVCQKKQIDLPGEKLTLRSVLGILHHQVSIGHYSDGRRLVITSKADAEARLTTRVYPLPQLAGPEQPFGADLGTWIEVLSVVIEPDSWDGVGGPAEIVPAPGALIIRQTGRAHQRLQQFFRRLENDSPTPDAQADYLSSLSPAERRIHAVLENRCDFQCTAAPLQEVIEDIAWKHGIPIILRQTKLKEAAVNLDARLTLKMEGASLRSVLRSLLGQEGLTYVIRDDILLVTTWEDAASSMRTVAYDVRDLVAAKGGPDFDSLIDLITSSVQPDSWDDHSGPGPLQEIHPGWLIFSETDSIHEGTAHLLTLLRQALRRKMSGERTAITQTPAERKITEALERNIKLDYQGIDLPDVAADLAERTGVNVRLDTWRLADLDRKIDLPLVCDLPPLRLKTALRRLLNCKELARAELAWCIRDESLVLTTKVDANSQHELLVMDVSAILLPKEDGNSFEEEKLLELIESIVRAQNSDGAASISIFQSLLVSSAPIEANGGMRRLVKGLLKYRDESLVASKQKSERRTAPVPIALEEASKEGSLVRIHPVEDLLGAAGPSAIEDLQDAIKELVLENTWDIVGRHGEIIPIPPGALLVSQTPEGHEHLQRFLDELRLHAVPNHPAPEWLVSRDTRRRTLEEVLSSREQILPAKDMYELARKIWQMLQRQISISHDLSWSELHRGHKFQDLPPDRGAPLPGSPPRTIREQLAGLGLAVVEKESRMELALAEEDVRLAFYDVSELLAPKGKFEADELAALFDEGEVPDPPEWARRERTVAPLCFRGWMIIRGQYGRLKHWEQLLAWLREQRDLPRAEPIERRWDRAETRPLVDRLLGSKSAPEQLYLSFVLQHAAAPEDGYDDLAALAQSLADSQDPLLYVRLKDVLHRWILAKSGKGQEALFATSPSPLLRKGAIQALAARVGAANTNYLGEAELRRKISARAELPESEVAELEICLERRQPPPIHRTNFENRLFAEDGPPILRIPSSRGPDRIPPWRRREERT